MYVLKNKFYLIFVALIDFWGYLFTFPFKILRQKSLPKTIKEILIIRLDHIGDVIYSTLLPENIKNAFPQAKITFLTNSQTKEIIAANPFVDRIICYDAPWFKRKNKSILSGSSFFQLTKQLKTFQFDLGFDNRGDSRHILLMNLAGVKYKIGMGITGLGFLLDKKVKYLTGHPLEQNLQALKEIGIKITLQQPVIYTDAKDKQALEDFLKQETIGKNDLLVTIHAYSANPAKNWPEENFQQLTRFIYDKYKAKVIFTGSQEDFARNQKIINASQTEAINASGKISLKGTLELLKRSGLFIGIDSAIAHLAEIAKVPAVILYSGTNRKEEWAPKNATLLQKDVSCSNCQKENCPDNICLKLISVQEAQAAIEKILKNENRF